MMKSNRIIFISAVFLAFFSSVCLAIFPGCATVPKREAGKEAVISKEIEKGAAPEKQGNAAVPVAENPPQPAAKKQVIFIADWGKNGPSQDIISMLSLNPQVVLAIPWANELKPTEQILDFVKKMQIEPVMTLSDEPILSMINQTRVSSDHQLDFSWPQDISNIVFKNQETFKSNFHFLSSGIYLYSGILSKDVIPILKKLSLNWVNANIGNDAKWGYVDNKFLVLNPHRSDFETAKDCLKWINSQSGNIFVIFFQGDYELTDKFILEFGQQMVESKNIEMITPGQLYKESQSMMPDISEWKENCDFSPWLKNPSIWYRLSVARNEIEKYKNSGSAKVKELERIKDEIYHLYQYDFLAKVEESPDSDEAHSFQASLNNIYSLMDRKESDAGSEYAQSFQNQVDTAAFHIDLESNKLKISNGVFPDAKARIESFSVELTKDNVIFSVALDSNAVTEELAIDIYMDLNNIPGAGLARLLPDLEAFVKQQDAWEFAIRMQNSRAVLYSASRFTPNVVRTFSLSGNYSVQIPRRILRGNPLRWGYQAVTLLNNESTGKWEISDFLCRDQNLRSRTLDNKPIQLSAVRAPK